MSPMASLQGILLKAMINAHEKWDVMSTDIPNTFIQTNMVYKEDEESIIMKVTGGVVDILVK